MEVGGCQGLEGWVKWEMLVKGHKVSVLRRISSEDPVFSNMSLVNNTVLYTSNMWDLKYSYSACKKW